ncbi:MAG: PCYCGC motif-containing (lipo)protein [Vicinamibacterales bacterium]
MLTRRASGLLIGAATALAVAAGCSKNSTPPASLSQPPAGAAATPAVPPSVQAAMYIAPDLPPLPPGIVNAVRPVAITKAAYEFAARHPEVMNYIPCFCGCERGGHKGNHDCFVAGRNASGAVTSWEGHGIGCEVCIDVATQTRQMYNTGVSLPEIRARIEQMYAGAPGHTPTPDPPRGGDRH